jgi:hypothetical protein
VLPSQVAPICAPHGAFIETVLRPPPEEYQEAQGNVSK